MSVSKATADSLLAEFLALREVPRYRAGHSGKKLAMTPDKLVKAEFDPDNSRIGYESKGYQSTWQSADWLAAYMVYEFHLTHRPLKAYRLTPPDVQPIPYVVVREIEQPLAPRIDIPTCHTEPITLGSDHYRKAYQCTPEVQPATKQKASNPKWVKTQTTPKYGQRPTVRTR